MAANRKIDYPPGLDKIAEKLGISTSEMLIEIANGDLMVVRRFDDDEVAADEALWDKQFAESQDFLDKLADRIHADYQAGLTEDFDPDSDPDLQ